MKLLKINNLSLNLKQDGEWKSILKNISFELEKGETIGIVGESGSGKSVTALSIIHLLNDSISQFPNGNILFFDSKEEKEKDLLTLKEKYLQKIRGSRIAMIFQEPMTSLNPVIRCGEQIMEALQLHTSLSKKDAKERVIDLFKEVMLPRPEKIFSSYPHELSGGQKQRVMIAMAMSCNPDILIADEPTTALDVTVQKNILSLIKDLQKKYGMSVIFITHDLGVVSEIADRVLVLYKGTIVEEGSAEKLFSNPQHPYTKGLLACRPPLDVRLKHLPSVSDFMNASQEGKTTELKDVQQDLIISPEERANNHAIIYSQKPLIQIKHLSKIYPVRREKLFEKRAFVHALQDVSLDIFEGETLGLVGESGCGKTTLGRSMIRLIEPTEGSVMYRGQDITLLSQREMRALRKDLQIILQDPYSSLNQRITIGSTLTEPMKVHGIGNNEKDRLHRCIEILERVGMNESHLYRYPHEFSGGQRQRISIARALTVNPKFIICDESVSALDVSVQAQVLNLLNELKTEYHFTYLFISHDLSVVKFMSDKMAVMQNGKIVEVNEADQIYHNPQTEYTQKLIQAIPKCNSKPL